MATLEHAAAERSTHARTLGEMFLRSADRAADPTAGWPGSDFPALRWKEGGRWVDLVTVSSASVPPASPAASSRSASRAATASRSSASTRPEWTIADAGVMCAGATVVPIYHTNSPGGVRVRAAATPAAGSSSARTPEQLGEGRRACATAVRSSQHAVLLTGSDRDAMTLDELCTAGADVTPQTVREARARGAAGRPGHARLHVRHHRPAEGLHAQPCEPADRDGEPVRAGARSRAAAGGDRSCSCRWRTRSRASSRWSRSTSAARSPSGSATRSACSTTSREVSPTHFPSVPRVFEKIFTRASGRRGRADRRSSARSSAGRWPPGATCAATRAGADRLAAAPPHAARRPAGALEGAPAVRRPLRLAMSGAAPIAAEVLEFFDACGVSRCSRARD